MACVATWAFGIDAVKVASGLLDNGTDCVEAIEKAINCVEDDPTTGVYYVGRGCYPNKEGVVQLDAAIMRGTDHAIGSVCSIERYPCPITIARHIMEHSPHNIMVGDGATQYALNNGFILESNSSLLVDEAVLALDKDGHVAAGVSTSGPPFKSPGRVGDSPLPGCGYYADKAGGAAATGDGETLMKFCPSFQVVQLMKKGESPQMACESVLKSMVEANGAWFEAGLVALDAKGNIGASGTVKEWKDIRTGQLYNGFPFATWSKGTNPVIITAPHLIC